MITSLQWREDCIFKTIISGSRMGACHHVAIVWGTVRGVPSIISLPSAVKAAFSPLMTTLFLNLNLCKAPQKKNDNELVHSKGGKLVYFGAITL